MDEQEAVEALWEARQEDLGERNPTPPAPRQPEQVETTPDATEPVVEGTTFDEEDSFTSYGPDDLPPELRPYYDSMLSDYRRKTQELAEERQQFEEIGGFEAANEAVEFATQLQTDPEFALEVWEGLSRALEAAGYTPEEAEYEATRQVSEVASGSDWDETIPDDWDSDQDIAPLQEQLEELSMWRDEMEQEREMENYAFEIQRQESAIRQANPEYTPDDIEDIYALAWHTGGDLVEAEKYFRNMNDRFLGRYLEDKASVPTGLNQPSASAPAQVPGRTPTLDEAHEAAVAKLRAMLEEEGGT